MKKLIITLLFFFLFFQLSLSQEHSSKGFNISPYAGFSLSQGKFKEFSKNGAAFGISIDKRLSKKFALGIDYNYQFNTLKKTADFSNNAAVNSISDNSIGDWTTSTLSFGPMYRIGSKKFNAEIYSKAGISYTKSPKYERIFSSGDFSKSIFNLPEQKSSSFGLTSGILFNYNINDNLSLFLNPQFVYSSGKIEYTQSSAEKIENQGIPVVQPTTIETISPSYFNLNAGFTWSFGKGKKANPHEENTVNRNIPICDLSFVELKCSDTSPVLQFNILWSNFDPSFTKTVEIFNGTTLLNTTSSSPQILSQNYGSIPFYSPIPSNLIGSNLQAILKIYNSSGNVVCLKTINFIVPNCTPPLPTCSFDLGLNNIICDSNSIIYNTTGTWSNFYIGSIITIEAKTQAGVIIPINNLPITITASNTSGSFNSNVSIPLIYNGSQISIVMKISEPTTGYEKVCGISDLITPICSTSPAMCDFNYVVSCDRKTEGIKINVNSNWNNMPIGSKINYTLFNPSGGSPVSFTSTPNNLPQAISVNGTSSHALFLSSNYSGNQIILKMEISDANGKVICDKVVEMKLPPCNYTTCKPILKAANCTNGIPSIEFSVPWSNYSNYNNYSIYVELTDANTNLPISTTFSPYRLTGLNGNASFRTNLPQQYSGKTIIVNAKICLTGGKKDCCFSKLAIDIPTCCENCSDIFLNDTTNRNQTNVQDFVVSGTITRQSASNSPITTITTQLESISFSGNGAPAAAFSNFEFVRGWFNFSGIVNGANSEFIGSISGDRSNFLKNTLNQTIASPINFKLNIDNYNYGRNLQVESYKVKFTIYKKDGTYCENIIDFKR